MNSNLGEKRDKYQKAIEINQDCKAYNLIETKEK